MSSQLKKQEKTGIPIEIRAVEATLLRALGKISNYEINFLFNVACAHYHFMKNDGGTFPPFWPQSKKAITRPSSSLYPYTIEIDQESEEGQERIYLDKSLSKGPLSSDRTQDNSAKAREIIVCFFNWLELGWETEGKKIILKNKEDFQ